jgi:peptidoglycan hydrolase-like protein with peptidoglycan-binding domain
VRERRNDRRRANARRRAGAAASLALRLCATAARSPVDSTAILAASAACLAIVVNAVFLQAGPHPAPFMANPTSPPQAAETRLKVAVLPPPKATARHNDPIAEIISASVGSQSRVTAVPQSRIMAVQRVLSDFGYGQIRPSGIVDEPTSAAIEKFESEHKLPVTGRLSDRLISARAAMTGRPVE